MEKVIVITGGTSGIGLQAARVLKQRAAGSTKAQPQGEQDQTPPTFIFRRMSRMRAGPPGDQRSWNGRSTSTS